MTREQVLEWTAAQYGTMPEYLWQDAPEYAVLRNSAGKWYGILMSVPRTRLGLDGDGAVELLNVKCDQRLAASLQTQAGFLPAYHMSKSCWISIILPGEAGEDEIKSLIHMSYRLTMPKRGRGKNCGG